LEGDMFAKYVQRYVRSYMGADEPKASKATRRGMGDMLKDLAEGR
jgi:hypothetical protein